MADEQVTNTETQQPAHAAPQTAVTDAQTGAGRMFTQSELDTIVSERLSRERAKYADYDQLKAAAAKWSESEAAKLSDLEKANKRAAELEAQLDRSRTATTRAHLLAAASRLGAVDPEAAFKLLDSAKLKVNDDGEPTNADEVLQELLKEKPYLKAVAASSPSVTNPARSRNDTEDAGVAAAYRAAGLIPR